MYYDLPNDWIIRVDGGKYLIGDFGSLSSDERSIMAGKIRSVCHID